MFGTQNETRDSSRGFTLTELLVVITIIAILAGLITSAALNAMNKAKQARITLELQQIGNAMADFKNEFGMYPPNVFANLNTVSLMWPKASNNAEKTANAQVLIRALKKSFPRSTEFQINLSGSTPSQGLPANDNVYPLVQQGLSPAEALVFWLQGFSSDISRPLSGTDLDVTQIDDNGTTINNVVTIDTRQPLYDFDRARLRISRDPATGDRRFITMTRTNGNDIQIQLYKYLAPSSQEPFVYFDISRDTPLEVVNKWDTTEFFYSSMVSDGVIFPLKQLRADAPTGTLPSPRLQFVDYVEKGTFQILHCGIDDAWGDFSQTASLNVAPFNSSTPFGVLTTNVDFIPNLLVPTGPFIGDIADTLGNFITGTLEDEQE